MDFKQAFLQKSRGSNASICDFNITFNTSCKLPSQSDECNNRSSSNNHSSSTHTGESNRGGAAGDCNRGSPSPVASPLLPNLLHDSHANNITSSISSIANLGHGHKLCLSEFDAPDPARLLNLACMHEPPSPSSSTLETQVLFNLNGSSFNNGTTFNTTTAANNINSTIYSGAPAGHHALSSYLCSSNHGSPTYARSAATACSSLLNDGSPHCKFYPDRTHWEEPARRHHRTFLQLPSAPPPQGPALFPSASRIIDYASLPCFNSEPVVTGFTPEQLLEFTQQTYIFKHFVAGVTPPPTLIINSVASMRRIVDGSQHFSGLLSAGGLRGNIDLEPGRCRRTDGKKWRCSREAVVDQKYCERHMHRGRHRARANKLANGGTDAQSTLTSGPSNAATNTSIVHSSNGVSTSHTATIVSSAHKEPHLDFSLQPASMHLNRSSISNASDSNHKQGILLSSSSSDGVLKRHRESNRAIGMSLAAPPENVPNLAELLKVNPSAKSSLTCNPISKAQDINTPFSFFCQTSERDADNSELRQLVDGDDWPIIGKDVTPSLSWFEQQNYKRSRYNTELSISTTNKPPLTNLSTKFGGLQEELDLAGATEASTGIATKLEGLENCSGRSAWVPIAWESPAIGGPLGEVLQSNATNFGGSLAKNGGARCLNLIEEDSWVGHVSGLAKDSHSPSLASPTGVLQMKASYSDSSSSASSPRASALKLEDSANLAISF